MIAVRTSEQAVDHRVCAVWLQLDAQTYDPVFMKIPA